MQTVIVGAGPAGLNCAYHLQRAGHDVIVLEKNEKAGPKVCAAGLTRKDLRYMDLPEEIIHYSYDEADVYTPNDKLRVKLDGPYVTTISREKLADWQMSKLNKGTVRTSMHVTEITDEYVIASGKRYPYDNLVGADGSVSFVRRHLGLPIEGSMTLQYNIKTDEVYNLTCGLDIKRFGPWYVWIFPHKGYISVGAGCNPNDMPPRVMREHFHEWLDEHGIDYSNSKLEGFPITYNYLGHKFGNIYLAGDAAGLASALTGEGIYQALVSGEEVAKSIMYPKYRVPKLKRLLKKKRLQNIVLGIWKHSGPFKPGVYLFAKVCSRHKRLMELSYWVCCG